MDQFSVLSFEPGKETEAQILSGLLKSFNY